tara:strand:- start:7646 stop:7852 length:207 start_codon:yes stop_codon:yes gene_type:complete
VVSPFFERVPHLAHIIKGCWLIGPINFGMAYTPNNPMTQPNGAKEIKVSMVAVGTTKDGFMVVTSFRL